MRVEKMVSGTGKQNLNVRSKPTSSSKVINKLRPGSKVTIVSERNGWSQLNTGGWVSSNFLKTVKDLENKHGIKKTGNPKAGDLTQRVQTSTLEKSSGLDQNFINHTLNSTSVQKVKALDRSVRIFGGPYQHLPHVDMRITQSNNLGRRYGETLIAEAPLVSFMPCMPNYLPDVHEEVRKDLMSWFQSSEKGMDDNYGKAGLNAILKPGTELRYYSVTPTYPGYIRCVNLLCRATAVFMGLGNKIGPDGVTKLGHYDWGTYKWRNKRFKAVQHSEKPSGAGAKGFIKTIFQKGKDYGEDLKKTFSYEDAVVRFYVDPSTSFSESYSNTTTASKLEGMFDTVEGYAKELAFFTGASNMASAQEIQQGAADLANKWGSKVKGDGLLKRLLSSSSTVIKGANIIFPELWSDSNPSRNYSISMTFSSPYGYPLAVYYNCLVPLMHVLALAIPIQVTPNSYRAPYLVKADSKGWFSCEMGLVESVSIEKDNWTINGFPTTIKVSMSITDLYNNLMITSTHSPASFFRNEGLMNYLAVTGNIDLHVPHLKIMMEVAATLLVTKFTDLPTDLGRNFINGIRNMTHQLLPF